MKIARKKVTISSLLCLVTFLAALFWVMRKAEEQRYLNVTYSRKLYYVGDLLTDGRRVSGPIDVESALSNLAASLSSSAALAGEPREVLRVTPFRATLSLDVRCSESGQTAISRWLRLQREFAQRQEAAAGK
jgi:hypothetical protein